MIAEATAWHPSGVQVHVDPTGAGPLQSRFLVKNPCASSPSTIRLSEQSTHAVTGPSVAPAQQIPGPTWIPTSTYCRPVLHCFTHWAGRRLLYNYYYFYYLFLWTLLANKSSSVTKFILYTIFCIKYICITLKGL